MPIPDNINREHIFRAIIRIEREGIPPRRGARRWALLQDGIQYPVKLVISWGNVFPNGVELDPDPRNFTTDDAQEYLINLNFEIIGL